MRIQISFQTVKLVVYHSVTSNLNSKISLIMVVSSIRSFLRRFVNSFLTETRTMTQNVSFHEKLDETTAEKQEKNDETTTEKQEPVLNSMKSLTLSDEKKFCLRFLSLNKGLKTILKHTVVRESPF
jgi:hypothetical protein